MIRRFAKENNEEERSAVVDARGQGKAGMGNADVKRPAAWWRSGPMRPKLRLWPTCRLTGIMAQVGRGMTRYVSKKMSKDSPRFGATPLSRTVGFWG